MIITMSQIKVIYVILGTQGQVGDHAHITPVSRQSELIRAVTFGIGLVDKREHDARPFPLN
jgi:hypothetical protein